MEDIKNKVLNWKCQNCKEIRETEVAAECGSSDGKKIILEPIGYISTEFAMKKGLPRQPSVCPQLLGKLTISKNVFTNPEHALESLNDYSHMWYVSRL